jgi:hypothetical protein
MALAFVLLPAGDAAAHLVQTGFGPLADTLVHMFLGPDAVMLAAAAGALSAMRGESTLRSGRWLFLYGWCLFFAAGLYRQYPFDFPVAAALTLATLGVFVAADVALPPALVFVLLGWAGGLYGLIGGGAAEGVTARLVAPMFLLDVAVLWAAFTAARAFTLRFPGARIAVRVGGSWITAIGLLQLGWTLRFRGV